MRTGELSKVNQVLSQAIVEMLSQAEMAVPEVQKAILSEAEQIDRIRVRLLRDPQKGPSSDFELLPFPSVNYNN